MVLHPHQLHHPERTDIPFLDNQDAAAIAACLEAPNTHILCVHDKQHVIVKHNDWQLLAVTQRRMHGVAAFRLRCGVLVVCWQHPVQPQVAVAAVQNILLGGTSPSTHQLELHSGRKPHLVVS